jgi:plastocyanin
VSRFVRMFATLAVASAIVVGPVAGSAFAADAPVSGKAKVKAGDNFFKPDDIVITAGTKVTWINTGKILHNVHPAKGKWGTKSLKKGAKYSYVFKQPGEYSYWCTFHGSPTSGQRGVIEVVAAETPTPTTTAAR